MAGIRIGGLASGMDVEAIIEAMVMARSKPIEMLGEKKAEYEEDLAAWSDVNLYMGNLTKVLNDLRTWETWNSMRAVSSNESFLTATATTAAVNSTYTITIDRLAQAHSVGSDRVTTLEPPVGGNSSATARTDLVAQGILTEGDEFTVEGHTITIGTTESLESLRNKINSSDASSTIRASILDNRLVITRINTGTSQVNIADTTGTTLEKLGMLDSGSFKNELVAAQDAQFYVNGAQVNRDTNTNLTNVIEGVALNLHAATPGIPVTLSVENNTEMAKTLIKDFIAIYNESATVLSDYGAISLVGQSQRGAEIDAMGMLAKDPLVKTLLSDMRKYATDTKFPALNQTNAAYSYAGRQGVMNSLSDIGIWTSSKENQLVIQDEERLDYMLDNYFDKVTQLFRGVYDSNQGYVNGVATDFHRWSDNVTQGMTGEIARRISRLQDQITETDITVERRIQQLERYETSLWAQFGAMENSIARMQSELSWLTSQLGIDTGKKK